VIDQRNRPEEARQFTLASRRDACHSTMVPHRPRYPGRMVAWKADGTGRL
jgi:hypothetical protein